MVVGLQPHWENIEGGGMRGGRKEGCDAHPEELLCARLFALHHGDAKHRDRPSARRVKHAAPIAVITL